MLTKEEMDKCTKLFEDGASRIDVWPEYWIHGDDESQSYCIECAEKRLKKLRKSHPREEFIIDGGWGTESADISSCEDCNRVLDTSLLSTGCKSNIAHYSEYPIEGDMDLYVMKEVINSSGWELPTWRTWRSDEERECQVQYYKNLHEVCRKFLAQMDSLKG